MRNFFIIIFVGITFLSCKKQSDNSNSISIEGITSDKWTKVNTNSFNAMGIDYVLNSDNGVKDQGILYLDRNYYYSIDSQLTILTKYKFSDYGIANNTEFFKGQFITYFSINEIGLDKSIIYQWFYSLQGDYMRNEYISIKSFFGDTTFNIRYLKGYAKKDASTLVSLVKNVRSFINGNQVNDSAYFEIVEFHLNANRGNVTKYYQLPNSIDDQSILIPIKNKYLVLGKQGIFTLDYFKNEIQQSTQTLPLYSEYKWYFNNRAFFTNKLNNTLIETSDGSNFMETISGFKISQMYKPNSEGFALCYAEKIQTLSIVNLNNNTFKTVDRNGITETEIPKAGMVYGDKLLLFTSNGLYARLNH